LVFTETLELGIALLEEGNTIIQVRRILGDETFCCNHLKLENIILLGSPF